MPRAVLVAAVMCVGAQAVAQKPPVKSRNPHTIETAGAVAAVVKQGPNCRAFAPGPWQVSGSRPSGDAFELMSSDRRIYAGWGIRGVNRAMEPHYGPLHGDPETSSLALVSAVLQVMGSAPAHYSAPPQRLGAGFIARAFQSATHKGIIVYRVYPPPPGLGAGSYIISLRIAAADRQAWDADGQRLAIGVAASIACSTMLTARSGGGGDVDLPRPGDPAVGRRRGAGETDELEDYNAQLGTQWVHSPSTGEKFMVDAAAAWNENGPDGPGYYRQAGNSYEKLAAGLGK